MPQISCFPAIDFKRCFCSASRFVISESPNAFSYWSLEKCWPNMFPCFANCVSILTDANCDRMLADQHDRKIVKLVKSQWTDQSGFASASGAQLVSWNGGLNSFSSGLPVFPLPKFSAACFARQLLFALPRLVGLFTGFLLVDQQYINQLEVKLKKKTEELERMLKRRLNGTEGSR